MLRLIRILAAVLLVNGFLNACSQPAPVPTLPPAEPSPLPLATPSATSLPDSGWETLRPGLEQRVMNLLDEAGQSVEQVTILRLEPDGFAFDIAYHSSPQTLEAWQAETGALLVVNGGFYRQEGDLSIPTGLTILDGQAQGVSYDGFAGMLAIGPNGPELRWLEQQPYDPTETLDAALQSFPILIKPGGVLGFPADAEDHQPARRTAIARDRQGRILFLVAQRGLFTLHTFSAFLADSDMELDFALNLDGGPSSGMLLAEPHSLVPAFAPLPLVITVRAR